MNRTPTAGNRLSRRAVLCAIGGTCIASGCLAPGESETGSEATIDLRNVDDSYLKIGIISDPHWRDEPRKVGNIGPLRRTHTGGIVGKPALKRNFDVFMDDMNDDFQPDLIVQQGDLADGMDTDFPTLLRWLREAREYLEAGLDAPVQHVIGNHEYSFAGSHDMTDVYDVFGWENTEDTYRSIRVKGHELLFLNTAYTTTDKTTDRSNHRVPKGQFDWLRTELNVSEASSVLPFVHVPLTRGAGGEYNSVRRGKRCLDLLHRLPRIGVGFFGHSHHATGWDKIRLQTDAFDTPHLHCCTPNLFTDRVGLSVTSDDFLYFDHGIVPYLKVIVAPNGRWSASASYAREDVRSPTQWGPLSDARRMNIS